MKKILILTIILIMASTLTGCKKDTKVVDNSTTKKDTKIQADNYCQDKSGQKSCPENGDEIVILETSYGDIHIKFFEEEAPQTVENFKKLVKDGFYDGISFHRIISGFMIQTGDPKGDGTGGPGYTVPAEISAELNHIAGAVATARLSDAVNPEKASSGSQFYIVHDDFGASGLDGDYTVFGQVIKGQNVVEKIATTKTNSSDKPINPIIIEKARLETYK